MLRCQPYRFQQLQHSRCCRQTTERNSTESRLFVVVDHHLDPWRCVGIVPADRGVKRVHAFFAPPAPHCSPQKARSGQTAGRVCATFKAHTKKTKIYRKHLHIDKAHSENVTHSNEERNTIRGRVAPSSQRQHTTFTMSSRVINPNKQVAHDAVKCGSPDGLSRRNSGWRSARKRDRPASDATLARKIGQRCASRRVQTCNNSEKRRTSRTAESDRVCSQWLKKTGARGTKSTTRCIHGCLLRPRALSSESMPNDDTPELRLHPRRAHVRTC